MAVIIVLRQGERWVSVKLLEQTNESTTDISTGTWSVHASSLNPGGGPGAANDLSPVNPEYYVWLYAAATLVLADRLPTSSTGGAENTKFDAMVWLTDVWRKSTENYSPTRGAGSGNGRFWRGKLLQPGPITWGRLPRPGSTNSATDRSPPAWAP